MAADNDVAGMVGPFVTDSALAPVVDRKLVYWNASVSRAQVLAGNVKGAYLAHPFAKKAEVEKEIQPKLEALGIGVLNPFQRAEQDIYEKAIASTGLTPAMCADIVNMDLEKIDEAKALIAMMIDDRMIGTIMEIFYSGHVRKYPTFVFAPTPRYSEHPWIRHLSTVSKTWDELEAQLKTWLNS